MRIFKPSQIKPEQKKTYDEYCSKHNINMFFPMALGVLFVELVILIFQYFRLEDKLFDIFYFYVYITAIVVSGIFAVIYGLYKMGRLKSGQKRADIMFIIAYLTLALMTTLAESLSSNAAPNNIIFTGMMLIIASLVYLDYRATISILIIGNVLAVVIILFPVFMGSIPVSMDEIFGGVLDLVFMFVATMFVCIPCYNNRTNMFLQEQALEHVNSKLQGNNVTLALLNKRLEKNAVTDGLTGVLNRFAFNKVIKMRWDKAREQGEYLGALMIDIDHFKQYNDTYGHIAGDECIKSVAKTIYNGVRNGEENLFRYGGEEFVVLLPDTNMQGALMTAQRITEDIRKLAIPHKTTYGVVTLSIGVYSAVPSDIDDEYSFIDKADRALYVAKDSGRNVYIAYTDKD